LVLSDVPGAHHKRLDDRIYVLKGDAAGLNRGIEEATIPLEIGS
jgi:hypothetical protein